MGLTYILAGLLFLFNPNINVIDVFPDFIGYLLIFHGLFHTSFLSDQLRQARDLIWKLALITAVRAVSVVFLPYTSDTFTLLLVFIFAVLETMYALPAIAAIFEGAYAVGTRLDCESIYDVVHKEKRTPRGTVSVQIERAERLKIFTVVFFLLKTVAAVLPELTALQLADDLSGDSRWKLPLAAYRPWMYVLLGLLVLVVGIVWLTKAVGYVNRLRRDSALREGTVRYFAENVASQPGLMAAIRMKKVLFLIGFAALSSITITLDGLNVLPNIIPSVFLFLSFLILMPYDKGALPGLILSVITGGFSIGNLFVQIPYFSEYTAQDSYYFTEAAKLYGPVRVCGMLEFCLLLASFAWVFVVFCRAVRSHTAYIGILGSEHKPQYSADARRKELYNSVLYRVIGAAVCGAVYLIMEIASYTVSVHHPAFWIASFVVSVLWVVMAVRAMVGAYEDVYQRLEQNY